MVSDKAFIYDISIPCNKVKVICQAQGQNSMSHYPFPKQALVFTGLQYKSFENTVGKGEIARKKENCS